MPQWGRIINRIAYAMEKRFDAARYKARRSRLLRGGLQIVPYLGYGSPKKIFLKGRVLQDKGIPVSTNQDNLWKNLANMYRRFNSHEVPDADIHARFYSLETKVTTNEEGFFDLLLDLTEPPPVDRIWHEVELELTNPVNAAAPLVREVGRVLIPTSEARFGIISDMDDTVIQTDAANFLRMIRTTLFQNARTRLPFKGVAAFYSALQDGMAGKPVNPLFYVSSGPWNLYDLLVDFFQVQHIPLGPIFLRDWGITQEEVLPTDHRAHKLKIIREILEILDWLPFILIGDSSQEDPEIYHDLVSLYPKRIQAIYIRNVTHNAARTRTITALAQKVLDSGSTLILANDTLAAARHAIRQHWIAADRFPEIHIEKQADEKKVEEQKTPTIVVENESTGAEF
jgi:phosphatidate phosphatase APP1